MDEATRVRLEHYRGVLAAQEANFLGRLECLILLGKFPTELVIRDLERLRFRGGSIARQKLLSALEQALRKEAEWVEDFVYHGGADLQPWSVILRGEKLRSWFRGDSESPVELELTEKAEALSLIQDPEEFLAPAVFRRINRYAYQLRTASRFLLRLDGSGIVADEPGLGKTIEAGILIEELYHRRLIQSCLVLTPASLVKQWDYEMRGLFSSRFCCPRGPAEARAEPNLIVSIHRAKASLAPVLRARSWDLVVVDECHMLKNAETQNFRFVYSLRKKFCLLMSATPLQNDLYDLYNLVTLCRPGLLGTRRSFGQMYARHRRKPERTPRLSRLLRAALTRTRRADVRDQVPEVVHNVADVPVELRPKEMKCHAEVFHFIRDWCDKYFRAPVLLGPRKQEAVWSVVLALILVLRMISSTKRAVTKTLDGSLRARLNHAAQFTGDRTDLRRLEHILGQVRKCDFDGKVSRLSKDIRSYLQHGKVIVFTEWLLSKDVIRDALKKLGLSVVEFYGGLSKSEKETAIARFRRSDVMVSTETGGEGLNLQFANVVVNFDLPWNPMKLEQRIGRIDRIGQKKPVWVFNYYNPATIDAYVMTVLAEKLHMFEAVVGQMASLFATLADQPGEPDDVEASISSILRDSRSLEEVYQKLKKLGERLERAREDYERSARLTEDWLGSGS